MEPKSIFLPVCAQVLVTLLVWLWLYVKRLQGMQKNRAHMQELADETRANEVFKEGVNPSDNFENLFELPVLFYVAALVIFVIGLVDPFYVTAAWWFVGFRAIHSFVHCSCNRVLFRFSSYFIGAIALWAIWIRLAMQLI